MDKVNSFDMALTLLRRNLDLRAERQNMIASNVANIDTPGYKAVDISFEKEMKQALSDRNSRMTTTNARHIAGAGASGQGEVVVDSSVGRIDGNNVDIDAEMTKMAENAIMYNATTKMIAKKFDIIKYAITYGGK